MKNFTFRTRIPIILLIVIIFCFNACTTIQFKPIAPPLPASKLRVAIVSITGDGGRYGYATTHQQFSDFSYKILSEHLLNTGIYEVVPRKDLNYAVGTQALNVDEYWWFKNDRALLKQYGKALYADYVMILKRDGSRSSKYYYDMTFINLETGKSYSVSDHFVNVGSKELNLEFGTTIMFPRMYTKLFNDVKGDLLATAVRKGRLMPAPEEKTVSAKEPLKLKTPIKDSVPIAIASVKTPDHTVTQAVPVIKKDTDTPEVIAKISPSPQPELSARDKLKDWEKQPGDKLQSQTPVTDKAKLVVYDFNANEQLKVVSLILSEALREELFKSGNFLLVNRENLVQVMSELNLQQSGLLDEKQVVKLGKWLAANEAVTGQFAQFGNSFILQAKRTDITTMSTLGFGSLKCKAGQEEELLDGLPDLARKITGF